MSIGGPCLWVSSLSSPIPSSLSAVSSHFSAVARHGDRLSSPRIASPLRNLNFQKDRESSASDRVSPAMQPDAPRAENALNASPVPGSMAASAPYSGGEIPPHEAGAQPSATREELLPRVKLEIPGDNSGFSMSQPQGGSDQQGEEMDYDAGEDHEGEFTVSPTDERGDAAGSDGDHRSSLEKKKMKRFR